MIALMVHFAAIAYYVVVLSQSSTSPQAGATVGGRRMEFLLAYTSSRGLFLGLVGAAVLVGCFFKGLAIKE